MKPNILFLVGPTGSGKSELAISLAKVLNGEIISCDSMLVYRGMNIGTAKLNREEREGIKHYLIDLKNPRQQFSVSEYRKRALEAIRKILDRKRLPIVVGGSGLYVQALIDGLVPESNKTAKTRKKLEEKLKRYGISYLYKRLKKIDPERACEILPSDSRRIIRALEIYETYHTKPSEWRKKRVALQELGHTWTMIGLMRDRQELYERINHRVERMIAKGFIREVKRLSKQGFSKTARQAIGYLEISQYLKNKISLDKAIEETKKRSRHLAKKQLIWFRKEKRIKWIFVPKHSSLNEVKNSVVNTWKNVRNI